MPTIQPLRTGVAPITNDINGVSDFAQTLLDDNDAAEARATLEISGSSTTVTSGGLFSYPDNGRKWAAALASRSTSSPARCAVIGDSTGEVIGQFLAEFRQRMARFNNGRVSPGWISGAPDLNLITDGVSDLHTYKFRLTTGSYNSSGNNVVEKRGLALYTFRLASGSVLTLSSTANANTTATFSTAEFHFTAHGTDADVGQAEIRIDGSLVQTINGYDAGLGAGVYESGHTYTWTGDEDTHTITITGADSDPFWFDGVYLANADETVYVYNAGNTGEAYPELLNVPTGHAEPPPLETCGQVDMDLIVFNYGINDYTGGAATLQTNVGLAIGEARANCDDVSIGVLAPYAVAARTDWDDFVDAITTAANTASVPVCDMSWMLETNASTTDPHALVGVDNIHIGASGGKFYADRLSDFVLGDHIDWLEILAAVIGGGKQGTFTTSGFVPALTVESPLIGAGTATQLLRHDNGSASTGLLGQIGMNGHGATVQLGSSITPQAWVRFRAPATWTDSSAPTDIEIGNCASGSTTAAVRARWLAGGGLQLLETSAPSAVADTVILYAYDNAGTTQLRAMPPSGTPVVLA